MKIIGKTYQGYICEVTKTQMQKLTGKGEHYSGNTHAHEIGAELETIKLGQHIKDMESTATMRKQAADLLRSAATIIETVPDTFKAPKEDQTQPTQ